MLHIEDTKKAVVFTDIKDFTLKNSLFTQLQIRKLLNIQDGMVIPSIKKYSGKVVKTIGDAFLIVFDNVEDAINATIEIQKRLNHYNSKVNFNLNKIELKIIINYGDVQKEKTLIGEDYFGDVINIASRLQGQLIENRIYATSDVINKLDNDTKVNFKYLGRTSLRGILYKIGVYEILYDENLATNPIIEKNANNILLTQELKIKKNDVYNIVIESSLITAIVGIQNIPLIGEFMMLPFHMFLLKKIANKFQVSLYKREIPKVISTMFFSLFGTLLIILFADYLRTTSMSPYSLYFSVLLNFSLTFLIGNFLSKYFYIKSQEIENTNKGVKNMLVK